MAIMEKYFYFKGLATRSEYWAVQLLTMPIMVVLALFAAGIATMGTAGIMAAGVFLFGVVIMISWLVLATTARRCRDAGINPWFTLAIFIPYFAIVPWVVFGVLASEKVAENNTTV
jgi:uncharacterized membrane protein YhaH (DUF805 family)